MYVAGSVGPVLCCKYIYLRTSDCAQEFLIRLCEEDYNKQETLYSSGMNLLMECHFPYLSCRKLMFLFCLFLCLAEWFIVLVVRTLNLLFNAMFRILEGLFLIDFYEAFIKCRPTFCLWKTDSQLNYFPPLRRLTQILSKNQIKVLNEIKNLSLIWSHV